MEATFPKLSAVKANLPESESDNTARGFESVKH